MLLSKSCVAAKATRPLPESFGAAQPKFLRKDALSDVVGESSIRIEFGKTNVCVGSYSPHGFLRVWTLRTRADMRAYGR